MLSKGVESNLQGGGSGFELPGHTTIIAVARSRVVTFREARPGGLVCCLWLVK